MMHDLVILKGPDRPTTTYNIDGRDMPVASLQQRYDHFLATNTRPIVGVTFSPIDREYHACYILLGADLPTDTPPPPHAYSVKQVARLTGHTEGHIRTCCRDGRIACHRLGSRIAIPATEVARLRGVPVSQIPSV